MPAPSLHGFLSYLMRCTMSGEPYTVFGYGGRQVRDNLHSADLVAAFEAFHALPRPAAVYNIGGGRHSNCSMLEAIDMCEQIAGHVLCDGTCPTKIASAITAGGSPISAVSPATYPDWDITTTSRPYCARSTTTTSSCGRLRDDALRPLVH